MVMYPAFKSASTKTWVRERLVRLMINNASPHFHPHAYAADKDSDTASANRLIAGHLTAFIVQVDGKDTHEHQHFRQRPTRCG
jgi:hypothetical protein